jgi:hypothetical protein
MPPTTPSPAIHRLEAITQTLSLPDTESARQTLAPYAPREEIEADLAEQIIYLRALIRDATRRALAPDLPPALAARFHDAIRGFQRDLRAMYNALHQRQNAAIILSDPDWDRSPYRRPIGTAPTVREETAPPEPPPEPVQASPPEPIRAEPPPVLVRRAPPPDHQPKPQRPPHRKPRAEIHHGLDLPAEFYPARMIAERGLLPPPVPHQPIPATVRPA